METEKLNKIVEISRDACYDLKLVLSSGNTDSDDMDEAVDTVVKAIFKGIEVSKETPANISTKLILQHSDRADEIIASINYFDGMARRRRENAVLSGNDQMHDRFMHKADIALRAKKRMEQLYVKHMQTLTLK